MSSQRRRLPGVTALPGVMALLLTGCASSATPSDSAREKPSAPPQTGSAAKADTPPATAPAKQAAPASACKSSHADGHIVVTHPRPDERVTSPLSVRGRARGTWFFEGDFPLALSDGAGTHLADGIGKAAGEWMTEAFVPFQGTVTFTSPGSGTGHLVLHKDNPSDDRSGDAQLCIPVRF